ncbi:hypothetical protein [Methyloligella solikamskensis]|uniref:Uncharacterized protein n=1 Tax=Methyloligella solikamskensis TaxID=1177756 RepID=A0ABW3JCI8_9HYPH
MTFMLLGAVAVAMLLWAALGRPLLDQALLEPFEEKALERLQGPGRAARGADVADIMSRQLAGLGDEEVYGFLVSHGYSNADRWPSLPVGQTMRTTSVVHGSIVGDKKIQMTLRKEADGASVVSARVFIIML